MTESLKTLIPEFLQDQLSDADKNAIRSQAATDKLFSEEIEFQKKAAQAIRDAEYLRMKKILQHEDKLEKQAESDAKESVNGKKNDTKFALLTNWKKYAVAALFATVCFSGWWLFLRQTPEKLFVAEFKPYENILANEYGMVERDEMKAKTEVDQAFFDLKQRKYAIAAAEFDHLAAGKTDPRFKFWQAQALAADGQSGSAISILKKFADDPKSPFFGAAHWYIALAYLRVGDSPNAKNWLEKITGDPAIFERKKEAAELLKKLD